ncbi:MAG: OmpA family protein [Pontixanthobacter sp.]
MNVISKRTGTLFLCAALALPLAVSVSAQSQAQMDSEINVYGSPPADLSGLAEGPEVEGFISARSEDKLRVTGANGDGTVVRLSEATEIRASKGLFGLARDKLGADALLNGLPVTIKTVEWGGGLVASQVNLRNKDLKTATMIRTGTSQGFAEQTAATEALRSRVADIDQYNVKATTNVYFDTNKSVLSASARNDLCSIAAQGNATDNALILVVGYTDSTGDYDYNQDLSEKRASRVVNHLQQACGWKPYRMLTPTGMSEADPLADNSTAEGKAQNRRVAVNILVSKSVDGL